MESIEARKLKLIQAILDIKDETTIAKIELFFLKNNIQLDWWDTLPNHIKNSYDEALKDMEQGNEIDIDDFLKKYKQ